MKNKKLIPYVAGIVMILLFAAGLWSMKSDQSKKQIEKSDMTAGTVKRHYDKGSMKLKFASEGAVFRVGQPVKITLIADTAGVPITDFDAVIGFNALAFKVENSVSLLSDFNIVPFENDSVLNITGFKTLGSEAPARMAGVPVAEITFIPLREGNNTFSVIGKSAKSSTKFIGENGEVYFPNVGQLAAIVQQ